MCCKQYGCRGISWCSSEAIVELLTRPPEDHECHREANVIRQWGVLFAYYYAMRTASRMTTTQGGNEILLLLLDAITRIRYHRCTHTYSL